MFYSLCLCFLAYDIICHNLPNSLSLEVLGFTHNLRQQKPIFLELGHFKFSLLTYAVLWIPGCHMSDGACQSNSAALWRDPGRCFLKAPTFLKLFWLMSIFFPPLQKINSSGLGCLHHRGQLCHLCTICKQAASEAKVTGMNTEAEKQRKSCLCPFHRIPSVNSHSCCKKCFIYFF